VALLDTREDGLSLALVRILTGATVALHIGNLGRQGTMDLVWVDAAWGGLRDVRSPLLDRFGGATPDNVHTLAYGVAAAAVLLAIGAGTRLAAIGVWLGYGVLSDLNSHAGGSYDELLGNVLFLLVLADSGARLSVDARVSAPRLVPAWPRWLLVFQLVVMYTSTGLQKLSDHWVPWGSHDALWFVLQQPTWHRVPMEWVAPAMPLLSLATVSVWCFEVGAPLLLLAYWFRHTRTRPGWLRAVSNRLDLRAVYLGFGFLMHLGIEGAMEVGPFLPATMTLYLASFAPDEWARWLTRAGIRRGPGPAGTSR
jgi:hypothetical protein